MGFVRYVRVMHPQTQRRWYLLAGAVPLLIYPGVLLAGVMGLAGNRTGQEPELLMFVAYSFLVGSIGYPLVYLVCLFTARILVNKKKDGLAIKVSAVPLAFLGVLGALFMLWMLLGG